MGEQMKGVGRRETATHLAGVVPDHPVDDDFGVMIGQVPLCCLGRPRRDKPERGDWCQLCLLRVRMKAAYFRSLG